MSRSIEISYRDSNGVETRIDVRPPYFLLGTQSSSMQFWSLPRLKEIGISRLADLGVMDPVTFYGWEMMDDLRREILLLEAHLPSLHFHTGLKAEWLSHLMYCYHLLAETAPPDSMPCFDIG